MIETWYTNFVVRRNEREIIDFGESSTNNPDNYMLNDFFVYELSCGPLL